MSVKLEARENVKWGRIGEDLKKSGEWEEGLKIECARSDA